MNQYLVYIHTSRFKRAKGVESATAHPSFFLDAENVEEVREAIDEHYRGVTNVYIELVKSDDEKDE